MVDTDAVGTMTAGVLLGVSCPSMVVLGPGVLAWAAAVVGMSPVNKLGDAGLVSAP